MMLGRCDVGPAMRPVDPVDDIVCALPLVVGDPGYVI